ncbi:hypothetical protein [Hungatella effluvii]|uniref:hypothetical protein n=1 Tax=Hungatella effluvii TaxID=1096246 RepID=UPI0022E01AE0|nr:hypothetical protein [Hungatella effluvii]
MEEALILDIDVIEMEHKKEIKKKEKEIEEKQSEVDALKLLLQGKSPEANRKAACIFFDTKCSK